jgi:hypothetical protein
MSRHSVITRWHARKSVAAAGCHLDIVVRAGRLITAAKQGRAMGRPR